MLMLFVVAVIFDVTKLPTLASPVTLALAPTKNPLAVTLPFATMLPVVDLILPQLYV